MLHDAGAGLRSIDTTEGWSGTAGDQFRSVFHGQPAKWLEAGDSFHTASNAVDTYSSTLTWAQGQAADAIRQWNSAQASTNKAKDVHAKAPPGTPFNDPGDAGRKAAQDTLDRARHQLDGAGNIAAGVVDKAKDKAPPKPGFWSKVGSGITHAASAVGHTLENAGKEVVNDTASLGNAALNHPGQFGAALGGAALTAISGLGEGAGGLLDASGIGLPAGLALNGASTTGVVAGVGITGSVIGAMAIEAAGEDHVQVFNTDGGGGGAASPGEDPPFEPPREVTGRSAHAAERMEQGSRGDGGVTDEAADDAFKYPVRPPKFVPDKYGGTYRYVGKDAHGERQQGRSDHHWLGEDQRGSEVPEVSVIDRVAAEHRDTFVGVLSREAPDLLEALRGEDLPSYQEWEAVQEVLNDEFSKHYGPGHEPDETGVGIDNALGAFMAQFPGDELPDYPYR